MAELVKKVATPAQREIVIGTAAKSLVAATAAIAGILNNLNETVEDLGLKIDNKTDLLAALDAQYAEKERQATINLSLNLQEKGLTAANELLDKQGKTSIDKKELDGIKSERDQLKVNYKDDLTKATAAIQRDESERWRNEKALLEATHRQNEAENKATINAQALQIKMLEGQITMLTNQLNAEREAGVKRAQANVAPVVNVGNQGR